MPYIFIVIKMTLSVRSVDMKWLEGYAKKYNLYYRGKPCVSKAIKHIIETAKNTERSLQPDVYWKLYREYLKLVEGGFSSNDAAEEIGLSPEMEEAYAERYAKMKMLEKLIAKQKLFKQIYEYYQGETNAE